MQHSINFIFLKFKILGLEKDRKAGSCPSQSKRCALCREDTLGQKKQHKLQISVRPSQADWFFSFEY